MSTKLRIFTLDHYWNCIEEASARKLFSEIQLLRKRGYGPDYPKHFLPFDDTDYYCRHYTFCVQDNSGGWFPIGAFRQVSLELCDFYRQEIPLYALVKKENAPLHAEALGQLIAEHRKIGAQMIYSSALTIQKEFRKDREIAQTILELVPALTHFDMLTYDVKTTLGAAAPRFKTDLTFQKWGYEPIVHNGVALGPFTRKSIDEKNDPALALKLSTSSQYTIDCYNKHRAKIDGQTFVGRNLRDLKKAA